MLIIASNEERLDYLIQILRGYEYTLTGSFEYVNKMVKSNATVLDYILALSDGLKYGNWPWIKQTKSTNRNIPSMDNNIHYIDCPAYGGNEFGVCTCIKMGKE